MQERIKELEDLLWRASAAYYTLAEPIMDDESFDALRDELESLSPDSPFLAQVGSVVAETSSHGVWPIRAHEIPMGSQLKVTSEEEFRSWAVKYTKGTICWNEKLDGFSLELVYDKGKLVHAVTRGNGLQGEDITVNAMKMQGVPHSIKPKSIVCIRGEAILHVDDWKAHFEGDKNPRNSAAGTARRKSDNSKCAHLRFYAYDVAMVDFDSEAALMTTLAEWGFATPLWGVGTIDEVQEVFAAFQNGRREERPYEIDGMVEKENDRKFSAEQGTVDGRPRAQRAYKFVSPEAESTILGIIYQTGRTGIVTPVAEITPTVLAGATISRVSLANFAEVRRLNVGVGSRVLVRRCNDVIPKIMRSVGSSSHAFGLPSACPSCKGALTEDGVESLNGVSIPIRLLCKNPSCPAQTQLTVLHYRSFNPYQT